MKVILGGLAISERRLTKIVYERQTGYCVEIAKASSSGMEITDFSHDDFRAFLCRSAGA